jgi:hypothetical protein
MKSYDPSIRSFLIQRIAGPFSPRVPVLQVLKVVRPSKALNSGSSWIKEEESLSA